MSNDTKNTALARIQRGAVEVYPDSERYRGGFGVRSGSSNAIHKISFDLAKRCWVCSCRGCITHGQCKHLDAAGLKGRKYGDQMNHARELGIV